MWAIAAIVSVLLSRTWFPFAGEPVADDFDYLHHALLSGRSEWLDGGGSHFYWRPLSRQFYFRLLAGLMLRQPLWVPATHAMLALVASVLLYRVFRREWPGAWAALAATFPWVMECSRLLLSWPSGFQDLSVLSCSALALHEAAFGRRRSAMAAFLAALLCKETAASLALMLPWMMARGVHDRRALAHWGVPTAGLLLGWGGFYGLVAWLEHGGEMVAVLRGSASSLGTWVAGCASALGNVVADASGLAGLSPPGGRWVGGGFLVVGAAAVWTYRSSERARRHVAQQRRWVVWGLGWYLANGILLASVAADWRPYRSGYAALGLGVASTSLLGAIHPALLVGLYALRFAALLLSPGAPAAIAPMALHGPYAIHFAELSRLQRLVGETHREVLHRLPPPAPRAFVASHTFPQGAVFGLGGDKSLEVWYGDTTLHWVSLESVLGIPERRPKVVLEFQPLPPRQIAVVEPAAMAHLLSASKAVERAAWQEALADLAVADSLQVDRRAWEFTSMVAGKRAIALGALRRSRDAIVEAQRGLALWAGNDEARFVLASEWLRSGHAAAALPHIEWLLRGHPNDPLLQSLYQAARRAAERSPP